MKSFFSADLLICSTILMVALCGVCEAELEQSKNRRGGGTSGLYAFPRVGRSDPSMANHLPESEAASFDGMYPTSFEDYEEYPKSDIKRASLIAFPRVGRNDAEIRKWARLLALQQALEKRVGPSPHAGLWFGPRLGKRSIDTKESEHLSKGQNEFY